MTEENTLQRSSNALDWYSIIMKKSTEVMKQVNYTARTRWGSQGFMFVNLLVFYQVATIEVTLLGTQW